MSIKAFALGAAVALAVPTMASAGYHYGYKSYSGPSQSQQIKHRQYKRLVVKYLRNHGGSKFDPIKNSHYGKRPWMRKRHKDKDVSAVPLPAGGLLLLTGLGGLAVMRARKKRA
ncbi:MAG: VPLPA-CTERM sorting domain-containing protein [Pseudomonadota bacterium]